jgi:membrane protease subunit HflK
VQVPEPVVPSQRDANKALADQERFIKESQAYANGIIPVAQGAAARLQQDAEAYKSKTVAIAEGEASRFTQLADAYAAAPDIMRKRLYIETMENVLGRSRKVLVDPKAGSNILYLPLDKLVEQSGSQGDRQPSEAIVRPMPEPETVTVDGRSREER